LNSNNIAIIPARGGSKRIPKKNIKDFLGKPIIAYSIEMAISCKLFNKVIVSTDDEEIKDVAIKYGAEVPFIRPKEIADDFTGTHEVIGHAVKWLEDNVKKWIMFVVSIQQLH
jgi:pseudaminic acid cytidylyltransferase